MITDKYKADLQETRKNDPSWGSTAAKYAGLEVLKVLDRNPQIVTVLDFGSGCGTLAAFIKENRSNVVVTEYDPSVPGKDEIPEGPFDLIVSTDVMEHIEPDSLNETLRWLLDSARLAQFHVIACGPTNKKLPDGRDVHLIQQPIKWWQGRFQQGKWVTMERAEIMQKRRGHERHRGWLYMEKQG